jgi:peptidoglycan lytic transglycosylase G
MALQAVDDDPPPPPPTTVAAPPPKPLKILFPEGFTRVQMADRITAVNAIARSKRKVRPRLSERAYLRLTAKHPFAGEFKGDGKPANLEGFLFPALYEFTAKTTTRQLVQKQLGAFERNWAKVDMRHARSKNLTRYDVVIIASMIEREVQVPRERPLVAAVIYNRLRNGMTLGIDATLRYGLKIPPTRPIRQSELDNPTPYNTRMHKGLPPTPIGNPGLASLQAAAKPAKVDYLFFVRNADCRSHFFTASESEFFARVNAPRC